MPHYNTVSYGSDRHKHRYSYIGLRHIGMYRPSPYRYPPSPSPYIGTPPARLKSSACLYAVRITIYGWNLGWCRVVVFRLIVLKGDYTAREDISEAGP